MDNKIFKQKIKQKDTEFEIIYNANNFKIFNNIYNCKYLYDENKTNEYFEVNLLIGEIRYRINIEDNSLFSLEIIKKSVIMKKDVNKFIRMKLTREKEIEFIKNVSIDKIKSILSDKDKNINSIRVRKRINKYLPSLWRMDFAINIPLKKENIIEFIKIPSFFFKKYRNNYKYQVELELIKSIDKRIDIKRIKSSFNIINKVINLCSIGNPDKIKALFLLNNYSNIAGIDKRKDFSDFKVRTETLTKSNIPDDLLEKYAFSIKFDGFLSLLFIHEGELIVIGSDNDILYKEKNERLSKDFNYSLFAAEKVDNTLYVFDCLVYKETPVLNKKLKERLSYVIKLENDNIKYSKRFVNILKFKKYYKKMLKKLPQDGIIFTPKNKGFLDSTTYKWKPIELQTIDFLVKISPDDNRMLELYVYANKKQIIDYKIGKDRILSPDESYTPVLMFKESLDETSEYMPKDLDNKIVEFKYEQKKWKPYKIRNDKKIANNIMTAKSTIENLTNPINLDKLF